MIPVRFRSLTATLASSAIALSPGFMLPFLAAKFLAAEASAVLLLAYSISVTLNGIAGSAVELNSMSNFGSMLGRRQRPSLRQILSLSLYSICFTAVISIIAGPVLVLLFGYQLDSWLIFLQCVGVFSLAPILFSASSVCSGALVSYNWTTFVIVVQGARAMPAVVVLVFVGDISVVAVAVTLVVGEMFRFFLLSGCLWFVVARSSLDVSARRLSRTGLGWQASSTLIAQVSPAIDRAFMAGSGPLQVVAYEMADRIFSAALQFLNSGLLLKEVGKWSGLRFARLADRNRAFSGVIRLSVFGLALSFCASLAIFAIDFLGLIPTEWSTGMRWSLVLLATLPCGVGAAALNRILVLGGRAELLLRFIALGLCVSILLKFAMYSFFGIFGVIVASSISRFLSWSIQYFVMHKRVRFDEMT